MSNWTRLIRVTPPSTTVVSIDEVKAHLNLGDDFEDDYLPTLIRAAEAYFEGPNGIGVALLTQTWRLSLDRFSSVISIPLGPVTEIVSITYTDAAGDTHEVDPASYTYDLDTTPLRIVPAHGHSWPSVTLSPVGAVKVVFIAGYGDPAEVPADIRGAILLLIGHLHRNREATADKALSEIPFGVSTILDRYRVGLFG